MPFTAPSDVTRRELKISFVDDSGDTTTERIPIRTGLTSAQIRTEVANIAAASSANVFGYEIIELHVATKDASVALDGEQNSVFDRAVIGFKREDTKQAVTVTIPALRDALMVGDTDNVDTSNATYVGARNAYNALLPDEFVPVGVRYTERREINSRTLPA
jgi:hypothetical protein